MKGLFVMFGRRSRDRRASTSKHSVLPLTVALAIPAFVSIPLVYYSEEAQSAEVYWECTQEAPLAVGAVTGSTATKRSVGYNTFNSGRSSGTLTVNCVNTATEVTYENFGGTNDADYPDSTNGMTGANLIDSDGAITYFLRGSGEDANRARWAVEREGTGNPPKQYLIKACTHANNSGKMCYVEAETSDGLADMTAAQLSERVHWRLMTITPGTTGNRKSAITLTPLAAPADGENLVEDNQDKFIRGMYETDSGTTTAVDSVLRNLNGLVKFKMVIDGLSGDEERVRSASSTGGSATEQENIVHIKPGGSFESVELQVTGGSVVTAGQPGVTNDGSASAKGSYGILVSDAEEDWTGPVTVEVSGSSRVETWASKVDGKHASGIHIDMGSNNNNVATVRVNTDAAGTYPNAGLRVRSSITHQPNINGYQTDVPAGIRSRFDMYGPESPAVLVKYPGGDGSVRVNLGSAILTNRDSSSGIEVQLAESDAPLPSSSGAYVKTSSPTGGIVYDIGSRTAVTTSGKASAGIIAEANYGSADPEDFHATIRIGDAIGTGARGETKIVVQNRITINDDKIGGMAGTGAQGKSHGVLVIATTSMDSDISDPLHPLDGRDWMVRTPRDIEIDVNNVIDMMRNGYAVALLGHTGRKNTVRVGLAGRLKAQGEPLATMGTPAADKNAVLFWKGDDTLSVAGHINGGSIDFGTGDDTLVMRGGVVGAFADNAIFPSGSAVTAGEDIDFGTGDDTLELRSGTVKSLVENLESLIKRGAGDAEIGDVTFDTANGADNTMTISNGRLIVSGHVNVGTGTVTVASAADLIIDVRGATGGNDPAGRITAASVNFVGKSSTDELVTILSTAATPSLRGTDITAAKANNGWLVGSTKVMASGTEFTFGSSNYKDDLDGANFILKRHVTIDAGVREMAAITFGAADDTGEQVLVVSGRADGAITFRGGDDELHVNGGVLYETVNMGADDDMVVVRDNGVLFKAVNMGDGEDTLTLHSGYVDGEITGLESLVKTSNGLATVGDVTFPGSTLTVSAGKLFISGHVNLGTDSDDVVTVNGGTIVIVATGASGTQDHGRITAGRVEFRGSSPTVEILATRATTQEADAQYAQQRWINSAASVVDADGSTVEPVFSTLSADPRTPRSGGPAGGGGTVTASDSDSNSYYALGAVAILWLVLRDDDDCCALVDYESDGATATFAGVKGAEQFRSGGTRMWAKLYSDSSVSSQQGLAVGMDSRVGEHGYFGVSAMPNISGAANTQGLSLNRRTSFEGGRYEAKGGWQKDSMFASVRLSHGEFRGSTSFRNLFEAGGQLGGSFDMSHSHLELGAGVQLSAGEQMTLVPSLGVYGGSMKQGGHAASNAVLVADVPGYSQSYQGWRAGVQLKSSDWLSISDSTKVRPQLGFNVYRTHTSGPGSLNMNQRDQLGILNFTNKLRVRGLPSTVNAFKAGLSMKNSSGASVKLNYVGYEADGKIQHGAIARMQVRF